MPTTQNKLLKACYILSEIIHHFELRKINLNPLQDSMWLEATRLIAEVEEELKRRTK